MTSIQTSTSPTTSSRRRLRVTTGCLTCRQRHVKCDERKPACANCGKKNRSCRYGSAEAPRKTPDKLQPSLRTQSEPSLDASCRELTTESRGDASGDASGDGFSNSAEESRTIVPTDPFLDNETAVSPFLATLGSILLDADYIQDDSEALRLQPAPIQPSDQYRDAQFVPHGLHVDYQIQLSGADVPVFRNYVDNVSRWVDSFSHDQPFHRVVPILALRCPPLLHSCLALSAKQLGLVGLSHTFGLQESDVVRYYRLALSAIRTLLLQPGSAQSDEVLAACIILSTYEMIDVVGESFGSHLTGVASLLQTRQVYGDVTGIRGSCYWTWYRHETWAALRTGRRLSLDETYWQPQPLESFDHLTPEDISNRVIFLFGQCINFCNDDETRSCSGAVEWLRVRDRKAASLEQSLDEWKAKLPPSMTCFASEGPPAPDEADTGVFGAMWFVFPQSAVANQVYHASKIILHLHRTHNAPVAQGLANCTFLSMRQKIENHRREIFLTANSRIPDAWSLVSSQCLYVAGLVTEGEQERARTLELIDQCQRDTGRKTGFLSDDLKKLWSNGVDT